MKQIWILALLSLGLWGLVGCEPKKTADETNVPSVLPISQEEAAAFAQNIEQSIATGDTLPFVRAMDWSGLTDAILKDTPENRTEGTYKRNDLYQSLSQSGGIVGGIAEKVKRGGAYQFLRVKQAGGKTAVMFRLLDPEGGVDYQDLHLCRGADGAIQVEEIYLYHFGETLSNALRRTLMPELYVGGQNSYGVMMNDVVRIQFRENMSLIQKMFTEFSAGNYSAVLDLHRALPEELRGCKSLQILRLQAAQKVPDPAIYILVLGEVRKQLGDDPCVEFLSLDYFFTRCRYVEALQCAERIDLLVGGDLYLNLFRSLALAHLGRMDEAHKLYNEALEQDPRLKKDPTFQALPKVFAKLEAAAATNR